MKGEIGPATLNVPTGVCAADGVFAVADAWRVLLWHGLSDASSRPTDVVLRQACFRVVLPIADRTRRPRTH